MAGPVAKGGVPKRPVPLSPTEQRPQAQKESSCPACVPRGQGAVGH